MSSKKAKPTPSSSSRTTPPRGKSTKASETSRRELLAARREADQLRQKRTTLIGAIIAAVLALAVIAVVAVVVVQNQNTKREQAGREAATQIVPPNAVAGNQGILANPATAAGATYTFDLYLDYQCPACKQAETGFGPVWKQLMDEGFVKFQIHAMTFMDDNPSLKNDHSTRVAIGAACADTRGKYWEFHNAAYVRQGEGNLYTETAMDRQIAQDAGLTGADFDAWQTCYQDKSTSQFVRLTDENATKAGVTSTPTILINGKTKQVTGADGKPVEWWQDLPLTTDLATWKKGIEEVANS